jgi:hypothetical protein
VDVQRIMMHEKGVIRGTHPKAASMCDNILRLVQRSGLSELVWINRMALYAAAGTRTASDPCD